MFYCNDCGGEFYSPKVLKEMHGLSSPPHETLLVCPICNGSSFYEMKLTHCRCCGAKLSKTGSEYCSSTCRAKGEKMWLNQRLSRKALNSNPIIKKIKELEKFNKENGLNLSYGQYVALTGAKGGKRK